MNTSPQFATQSRKPLYFEEMNGKVKVHADQKEKATAFKEMKRQSAFERLRAIRQKKNQKSQKCERPITYSSWPSESDSDTDSEQGSPFSTQKSVGGRSGMPETLHRGVLGSRNGSSTLIDSPFLPLRKRIKLRHPEASGSSQSSPVDNTANSRFSHETDSGKLDPPDTRKVTSPCPDFVSARHVLEGSGVEELALSSFIRDKNSRKPLPHRNLNKSKGKGKSVKKDLSAAEKSPRSKIMKSLYREEDDGSDHSEVEILSESPSHSRHKQSKKQLKSAKTADLVHTKKFYKNTSVRQGSLNTKKRTLREQSMRTSRSQAGNILNTCLFCKLQYILKGHVISDIA